MTHDSRLTIHDSRSGMTLVELLVASILIGIVMIGAFSFSQAIKQIHQSTDRSTIPAARVAAALAQIIQDASFVFGDGFFDAAGDNYGIFHNETGDARTLCFRHDTDAGGNPLVTPGDYSDDIWVCYEHDGDGKVRRCTTTDLAAFSGCPNSRPIIALPTEPAPPPEFYAINQTGGNLDSIDITLATRIDPAMSVDPMSNPEFSLTTTVNPWGQGR